MLSTGVSDANLGLFGGRQRPEPHRRPEHDGQRQRSRRVGRQSRRRCTSTAARSRTRGPGSTATRREPSATRGISSARTSTSCSPRTRRSSRTHVGQNPLRDPQPDEHGEVQTASTRTRSTRRASAASRSRPGSCGSGSWRSGIDSKWVRWVRWVRWVGQVGVGQGVGGAGGAGWGRWGGLRGWHQAARPATILGRHAWRRGLTIGFLPRPPGRGF